MAWTDRVGIRLASGIRRDVASCAPARICRRAVTGAGALAGAAATRERKAIFRTPGAKVQRGGRRQCEVAGGTPERSTGHGSGAVRRYALALLAALAWPISCFAHEVRPSLLQLHETASGQFDVLWKTPMLGDQRLALEPQFSGETTAISPVFTRTRSGAALQTWAIRAPALRGQTLRIVGLEGTMTDALVHIEFADGVMWTQRLTPHQPTATIPAHESAFTVAAVFLKISIEHILTAADHL